MSPSLEENRLSDMHSDRIRVRQPIWMRFVVLFGVLCVVLLGFRGIFMTPSDGRPAPKISVPVRTPMPHTDSFVDTITGEVLFFREGELFAIEFPSRLETKVIGLDGEKPLSLDPFPVTWSEDGKYIFILKDRKTLIGTEYDTQSTLRTYSLREPLDELLAPHIHISPYNDVVVIGTRTKTGKEALQFFLLQNGRDVGFYDNCSPKGLWIPTQGFVAKCRVGDVHAVVLVRINETSTQMTPVAKDTKTTTHDLLLEYDDESVMIDRRSGSAHTYLQLDANGRTAKPPAKYMQGLPSPEVLLDPYRALAKRIETKTGIQGVSDVSVSSNNLWMTFSANGKLYIARMDLQEPPLEFASGQYARIRP